MPGNRLSMNNGGEKHSGWKERQGHCGRGMCSARSRMAGQGGLGQSGGDDPSSPPDSATQNNSHVY